jgi:hypothetical protein
MTTAKEKLKYWTGMTPTFRPYEAPEKAIGKCGGQLKFHIPSYVWGFTAAVAGFALGPLGMPLIVYGAWHNGMEAKKQTTPKERIWENTRKTYNSDFGA